MFSASSPDSSHVKPMASTSKGASLTTAHRATVRQIRAVTLASATKLWRDLDPRDLDRDADMWARATMSTASTGKRMTAIDAAKYAQRYAAAETRRPNLGPPITPIAIVNRQQLTYKIGYGIARVKLGMLNNEPLDLAMNRGLASVLGTVGNEVAFGSRDTILSLVSGDNPTMDGKQRASAWARTASATACAFCAMLAGRGDVYHSEDTASFESHDNCDCSAELVYTDDWTPSPTDQAHRESYDAAIEQWKAGDIQAKDRLNAYRQYLGNN